MMLFSSLSLIILMIIKIIDQYFIMICQIYCMPWTSQQRATLQSNTQSNILNLNSLSIIPNPSYTQTTHHNLHIPHYLPLFSPSFYIKFFPILSFHFIIFYFYLLMAIIYLIIRILIDYLDDDFDFFLFHFFLFYILLSSFSHFSAFLGIFEGFIGVFDGLFGVRGV